MKNNRTILFLLLVGLILSSLIRIVFNISNGFEYQEIWIKILPLPIFDFAMQSSSELVLTSTFVGYIFYFAVGIMLIIKQKDKLIWIIPFLLIVVISIYFEVNSAVQDINSNFSGQHLRIGPLLFLVGLFILTLDYWKSLLKN